MTTESTDAAFVRNAIVTMLSTASCHAPEDYANAMLAVLPDWKPGRVVVVTESVPDPRGSARPPLEHRVIRILNPAGEVRYMGNREPMTVRDLLAELWFDRGMHARGVSWRPYGATLG